MSLYGALFSGVSGLQSQSSKIGVISDNISNVNTVGFKGSSAFFKTLVTGGSVGGGGGVLANARQLVSGQGLLQSTNSPTDIAISGSGFFVVNETVDGTGRVLFTRAGNFSQDATGNFKNSAGFYLRAWPLDRNGLLPGEPGNLNTVSSANLSSLQTVNVQNLTGTASATTTVSFGANLDAQQVPYLGAGVTAGLDRNDSLNYGATGLSAKGILVPSSTDSLTRGDSFKITTTGGVNQTYTYGGFTYTRSVSSSGTNGDSGAALFGATTTIMASGSTTPVFSIGSSGSSGTTVTVAHTSHGMSNGDTVTLDGNEQDINGIAASKFTGNFIVSNVTTNSYDILVDGTSATSSITQFATTNGSATVTVTQASHGLFDGDEVTITSATPPTSSSLSAANLQGTFTVTVTGANTYTITAGASESSGAGRTGGSATSKTTLAGEPDTGNITADTRLFTGNILNASTATDPFLGTLSTSDFTAAALTFSIATATASSTFTYVAGTPNTALGQFNSLNSLATAINSTSTLTARVVSDQLYVGSINATDSLTFTNGSRVGVSGPPVQSGINWVGELGLDDSIAAASNRFSSLQGLANVINATSGLKATLLNPTGTASLKINVADPLNTITLTDTEVGAGNTGSVLAALGIVDSLNGIAPASGDEATTGALGPSYDASNTNKSMAGGNITPQFSRPIQIFDALGTPHTLNMAFIKTGTNTWAAEVYAVPETDVTATDGLIASGTITFNGDGTLANVSTGLSGEQTIVWSTTSSGAGPSTVTFNWGTPGQPFGTVGALEIGKADGLGQFATDYRVNYANQNGAPVGELSSVSVDEEGFIIASYTNGETQKLYKIPLAKFSNPDELRELSGNVYGQTESSGAINLAQAGQSGAGTISSSSLEASNVELANELTEIIVAQRAYQANTKVISTADQLLSDLNQVLR